MAVKRGYKKTELGVLPEDWRIFRLREIAEVRSGFAKNANTVHQEPVLTHYLRVANVQDGYLNLSEVSQIEISRADLQRFGLQPGDVLMNEGGDRDKLGRGAVWTGAVQPCVHQNHVFAVRPGSRLVPKYLGLWSAFSIARRYFLVAGKQTTNLASINKTSLGDLPVVVPSLAEQHEVAEALSDADALIESLEQLIDKKRHLKQGAMQKLLTGKRRLPGFNGEWGLKTILEVADCLDNLRIPMNEAQRSERTGDYPYCGANGVLGFVDDFVVDDDIILIAEDGGYFDEYYYRPIAYRMIGKCWVNNHAHILKAKPNFDQGFLFYSLVHKNILSFLASGTRAKLNKSEMLKIELNLPTDCAEQAAVSRILSDMDAEIEALESRLAKARQIKQGIMQELLTGRIRLV